MDRPTQWAGGVEPFDFTGQARPVCVRWYSDASQAWKQRSRRLPDGDLQLAEPGASRSTRVSMNALYRS